LRRNDRAESLGKKDLNGGMNYLELPSLRPFTRKRCLFLVDESDLISVVAQLPKGTPVASWQAVGRLQAALVSGLAIPENVRGNIKACVARHYTDLGMGFDAAAAGSLDKSEFTGNENRYGAVREKGLTSSVERFLLGAEVSFCARAGRMPEPPYSWLAAEPSFIDIVRQHRQTTQERGQPLWQLP
jgi:hypothetical protein